MLRREWFQFCMKSFSLLSITLWLAVVSIQSLPAQDSSKAVSLFNGQTLAGWDFDPKMWRVVNGVITGGSTTENVKKNDFISTTKSYQNFDLSLKIKCSGDRATGQINSGIQIRSVRMLGHGHMVGYQVDCGKDWFGKIFDEGRRRVLAEPVDAAALSAAVDIYSWNEYRILAEGPRIQVWINEVHATDYTETDPNIALDGHIAPHIHSGGKCVVDVGQRDDRPHRAGAADHQIGAGQRFGQLIQRHRPGADSLLAEVRGEALGPGHRPVDDVDVADSGTNQVGAGQRTH